MPKKGTKKGGGKQAGLTEEERLLNMQQKAKAEEEMAKRKEDMLTQFLKDKLQKEERNSRVNLYKLREKWRALLRQGRAADLRSDIAVLSQNFERVLDSKNSVIQCLVSDLNEADEQSAQAWRSHLQCLDQLLELQRSRLSALEMQWNSSVEELSSEYSTERQQILAVYQQQRAYLENVNLAMEEQYCEMEDKARQDYLSTHAEIKNKSIEEKHTLRIQLEGKVEHIFSQHQQLQQNYTETSGDRRVAFEALRARDKHCTQEIDRQTRRLQKMQDSISALRSQLSASQKESESVSRGLRGARDEVAHKTRLLKDQLSSAQTINRKLLTTLIVQSDAAAKKLQGIIAKGEKLLRLSEMCRKLETEREKVLPFSSSSLSSEEQSEIRASAEEPLSVELAKALLDFSDLERFWQRYVKVRMERLILGREKAVLSEENKHLRMQLRQYLDGISVNDKSLYSQSSLLVVSRPKLEPPTTTSAHRAETQPQCENTHAYTNTTLGFK
ncbi:dynein regulatory complex subunit 2 [Chanos chanos]|uniref:Dynein regulatory complex subunit 2 n=1 Tax=Chanos chanos TaxID=29144 RepID=A0A6J2VS83_CHACN|nr:dynein regulatory complex subunit 2 [Chanos chanos]